ERIRTLFREQGITIASISTAIGMAISTFVLTLAVTGGSVPAPTPKTPDKSGLKEWVKNTCRPSGVPWLVWLERLLWPCPVLLTKLSLVSWGRWGNLWALAIAAGTLFLVAARDLLA
ncbi:MAG: hypothetical protein AB2697_19880, partial [Candidatus Thiodiazotropha endolucinida]